MDQQKYEEQLLKLKQIHEKAKAEARIVDEVVEERKKAVASLVGDAWKTKTFPDRYRSTLDPLLARKFKTKAGLSSIRLEQLLLDVDRIDTFGNENLRAQRKEEVKYIQSILRKADALNVKAAKLVGFQERLANIGRQTLKKCFEAAPELTGDQPKQEVKLSPSLTKEGIMRKRKLTDPNPAEQPEYSVNPADVESMDVEKDGDEIPIDHPDSANNLVKAQEEMDRQTEEYYNSDQQSPESTAGEGGSKGKQNEKSGGRGQHKSERVTQTTHEEPGTEPNVRIEELPRAFVMTVVDHNAPHARVAIDNDGVLSITVPGKSPVRYSLGQNINMAGVTKEIQGRNLRIVLPRRSALPMRTGRSYNGDAMPRDRRRGGDFWSRF
jgi:hypothetical protein